MLWCCLLILVLWEQDRVNVYCVVQDVQYCYFIFVDLVENQVVFVYVVLDVLCFILWDDWSGFGEVSQIYVIVFEFVDKVDRVGGIVLCDVVVDGFQICFGFGGDFDDYFVGLFIV